MIWKERGVQSGSYMCFFKPTDAFKEHYYYMYSCGFFSCDSNYSVTHSSTHSPLFIYVTSGGLGLNYDGQQYSAGPGDILIVNCMHDHRYFCPDACEFLFFHYGGKDCLGLTDHLLARNGGPLFQLSNHAEIYDLIKEPIMRFCYQETTSDARLSVLVYQTLLLIEAANEAFPDGAANSDIIAKAIEYIKRNIDRMLSVSELADEVGLSEFYFSRLFKERTGYPPIEYASMLKINYAKLMLRTTNSTVGEIAAALGYSSEASFINAFCKRRGISPLKYRKQHEKRE